MTAERLQSAGEYINNVLVQKGYIREHERLVFATEGDEDVRTNTRRTVNVIYALLTTVEQSDRERETGAKRVRDAEDEAERAAKKLAHLEGKTDALERQVMAQEHANGATQRALAQEKKWKVHYKEQLGKAKSGMAQLQKRFETELRKKEIENSRLRERLLEPRRGMASGPGTISSVLSSKYNSYGRGSAGDGQVVDADPALSEEIYLVNRKLADENETLMAQLARVRSGIAQLTTGDVAHPDDMVWETSGPDDSAGVAVLAARAQRVGDEVSASLGKISEILYAPNFVSLGEMRAKERENESLRHELADVTAKWQRALQTMEEWKALRSGSSSAGRAAARTALASASKPEHTRPSRPSAPPQPDPQPAPPAQHSTPRRSLPISQSTPQKGPVGTDYTPQQLASRISLARSPLKGVPSPIRSRQTSLADTSMG